MGVIAGTFVRSAYRQKICGGMLIKKCEFLSFSEFHHDQAQRCEQRRHQNKSAVFALTHIPHGIHNDSSTKLPSHVRDSVGTRKSPSSFHHIRTLTLSRSQHGYDGRHNTKSVPCGDPLLAGVRVLLQKSICLPRGQFSARSVTQHALCRLGSLHVGVSLFLWKRWVRHT